MEIINDDEEISKLGQDNKFQKIKVCLNGIYSSGKTTFLKRITSRNNFNNYKGLIIEYSPTIGASYNIVFVKYKNKVFKLEIWDISGQIRYFPLLEAFNKRADLNIYFYDPFNKDSFEYIKKSYQKAKELNQSFLFNGILIKSKCDLNETKDKNIIISDEEVLEYAVENNLSFRNLSNLEKYGSGIEEIIEDCINSYLHKNNEIK